MSATNVHGAGIQPRLLYFHRRTSGPSRRAESYLAQVLQRGHNHETFAIVRVMADLYPQLAERLGVTNVPTLIVMVGNEVRARLDPPLRPAEIEDVLGPWLT